MMELVVVSKDDLRDLIVECLSLLQPPEQAEPCETETRDVEWLAGRFAQARESRAREAQWNGGECLSCRREFHKGDLMNKVFDFGDWKINKDGGGNKEIGFVHKAVCPIADNR